MPARRFLPATAAVAAILAGTLTGCGTPAVHPGPAEPSTPAATTAGRLLTAATLTTAATGTWTAVTDPADYTPHPCGTALIQPPEPDGTATWRAGARLVQVQLHPEPDPRTAKTTAASANRTLTGCTAWIDNGAAWARHAIQHGGTGVQAAYTSTSAASGTRTLAWALVPVANQILTVTVLTPGADTAGAGALAHALAADARDTLTVQGGH